MDDGRNGNSSFRADSFNESLDNCIGASDDVSKTGKRTVEHHHITPVQAELLQSVFYILFGKTHNIIFGFVTLHVVKVEK